MYPQTHFLAGLAIGEAGVALKIFNQNEALTLAGLALLIDLDHYFYYSLKHKTLSLSRAWQAAVAGKEEGERTALHHWTGFFIFTLFLIGLSFFSLTWSLILGLAYYSHFVLDKIKLGKNSWKFKLGLLEFKLTKEEIVLNLILILIILFSL